MAQSIDTMPLMVGDVVRLLPAIIRDLMIKPNQRPAEVEGALKQIGGRLLEMSGKTTNDRSRLILSAAAQTLMDPLYGDD